ncbi:hypothetical protein [Nodularia sp. UHCC 0506]|uniref:hypothetical protein n=1 Tax=Nodularia sp. UHCC 0506 TaxID=3110243 RepID=UPI002B21DBAA|nr:hypothetical protein [Nodularia sp. UHCC 0506]MEA5515527.1 hypothetical protein [Nodularia sp. UHCC 0506]
MTITSATLFNIEEYNTTTTKADPYWDEIVLDCSGKVEQEGQLTLFYDDSQEPPEPDDFVTLTDYEQAWSAWERRFPGCNIDGFSVLEESVPNLQNLDCGTVPIVLEEFYDDGDFLQPHTLPEHTKQWIEEYYVKRCGTKHWYFRYCYYSKRIHHIHIPGGNYQSAIAIERKQMIESAIALGKSPSEIKNFIRGGFGMSGYRL